MKNKRVLEHWHKVAAGLILFDVLAIISSFFVALWLRFDCRFSMIPAEYLEHYRGFMPIAVMTVSHSKSFVPSAFSATTPVSVTSTALVPVQISMPYLGY